MAKPRKLSEILQTKLASLAKPSKFEVSGSIELRTKAVRAEKRKKLVKRLEFVIPPKYRQAHLRDLSDAFKYKVLEERRPAQGLYLWGTTGIGKTYAMAAFLRHFLLKGRKCKRVTYETFCLLIRDTFSTPKQKSEYDVIQPYLECDYLFLEDVGTTTSDGKVESDFSLRTLYVILDTRLENCRATFITSNKSIESLRNSFDERIASRLSESMVIRLDGKDKRKARTGG